MSANARANRVTMFIAMIVFVAVCQIFLLYDLDDQQGGVQDPLAGLKQLSQREFCQCVASDTAAFDGGRGEVTTGEKRKAGGRKRESQRAGVGLSLPGFETHDRPPEEEDGESFRCIDGEGRSWSSQRNIFSAGSAQVAS